MFEAMVTSPLTVAVFEAAMVRLSAVTAALKVALLFKIISASEVVPTIPENDPVLEPKVKVRSRLGEVESLSTVEEKLTTLFVVVKVVSAPNTTASLYA